MEMENIWTVLLANRAVAAKQWKAPQSLMEYLFMLICWFAEMMTTIIENIRLPKAMVCDPQAWGLGLINPPAQPKPCWALC